MDAGSSSCDTLPDEELGRYEGRAERMYPEQGGGGEYPPGPPWSEPFPHPAVSHEPRLQQLSEDFANQGLRPFHTPLGILLDEKNPQASRCIRCNTCDGFPCLVRAKADAQGLAADPALEYPTVTP